MSKAKTPKTGQQLVAEAAQHIEGVNTLNYQTILADLENDLKRLRKAAALLRQAKRAGIPNRITLMRATYEAHEGDTICLVVVAPIHGRVMMNCYKGGKLYRSEIRPVEVETNGVHRFEMEAPQNGHKRYTLVFVVSSSVGDDYQSVSHRVDVKAAELFISWENPPDFDDSLHAGDRTIFKFRVCPYASVELTFFTEVSEGELSPTYTARANRNGIATFKVVLPDQELEDLPTSPRYRYHKLQLLVCAVHKDADGDASFEMTVGPTYFRPNDTGLAAALSQYMEEKVLDPNFVVSSFHGFVAMMRKPKAEAPIEIYFAFNGSFSYNLVVTSSTGMLMLNRVKSKASAGAFPRVRAGVYAGRWGESPHWEVLEIGLLEAAAPMMYLAA